MGVKLVRSWLTVSCWACIWLVVLVGCTPGPLMPAGSSATINVTRPVVVTAEATATPAVSPTPTVLTDSVTAAMPLPTLQPPPAFIKSTNPAASSSTWWPEYSSDSNKSMLCVDFTADELVESGDNFTSEDIFERVSLLVNGESHFDYAEMEEVSVLHQMHDSAGNVIASWGGPYSFCWRAELSPGTHQAEFQFRQTSGTVQSYHWQFILTEGTPEPSPTPTTPTPTATLASLPTIWPLPTAEPMPDTIYRVYPEPASILTLPTKHRFLASEALFTNEICVGVNIPSLTWLEPGVWSITLNGTKFNEPSRLALIDEYLATNEPEETAEARERTGAIDPCWEQTGLEPGTYEALFEMTTPSGELLQYRWFFTLTES